MAGLRIHNYVRYLAIGTLAASALAAAEHHGKVQFGGLPLPGASIMATQADKTLTAVTDTQGAYTFPDLADGAWAFQVDMLCFETIKRDVIVSSQAPEALWDMKLLSLAEIKATAKPAEQIPATSISAIPHGISTAPLSETPAPVASSEKPARGKSKNNKAANATPPSPAQTGFQRADLNASSDPAKLNSDTASGEVSQSATDGFLVNGSVNNGAASAFAQSNAFGNNRKNGRSLYTGAVGVNLGNSALDAQSFSLTGQNTPKPAYNRLQGMASFGGPIYIPHLMKPARYPAIFFATYQWARNRNANTQSTLVPTALERNGDLSQSVNALAQPLNFIDPATGAPFPGNVIPQSRISQQALSLLRFYPTPNFAQTGRYNYQVALGGDSNSDAFQTNINKTLSQKNQISGNFAFQRNDNTSPNLFDFTDTTGVLGLNTGVNFSHRFNQHLFARIGVQYSRYSVRTTPFFAGRENVSAEAGISGNNQDAVNWGPPGLAFSSGIAQLSDAQQSFTRNQTSGISLSGMWNRRSHNVTFGGDLKRQQFNYLSQQDARGHFTFTGAATQSVPGTGSDLADFLLGVPDTSSIAFGNADKYLRASAYDAFVTDDWRVRSGLTLNAGVRWEYGSPITELYGRLVNLDVGPGYASAVPVIANNPIGTVTGRRYDDSLVRPDKGAFQPRVAIAWRPLAASSMIVRAGYGVYYNTSTYQSIAIQMAQQSPLSKSLSVSNTAANPLTLANGFNVPAGVTTNTFAIDPAFRVGYAQNWNVSMQRDLPAGLIVTATYLGIKGTREQQQFLPNTFPVGGANPCPLCLSGYSYLASNGNSTRESGQLQVRRRLHAGLTASIQYTYSKSIDDASLGGRGQGTAVIAQNWLNLSGERGLSSFDQRHLVNFQMQYSTGVGVGGGALLSGWRGLAFKEWTFTSQINAGSGLPQTPAYIAAVQGTGVTGSIRPSYTGASLYDAPAGFYLNRAAYAPPATGQWGTAGRDSITGPNQFSVDASMSRTFRINDRFNADFRLDSTNALNHVTYTGWNTAITSSQFGLPVSANGMRTVRAGVRVRF